MPDGRQPNEVFVKVDLDLTHLVAPFAVSRVPLRSDDLQKSPLWSPPLHLHVKKRRHSGQQSPTDDFFFFLYTFA